MSTGKTVPLTCHGHSRPVTHLSFSAQGDDEQYYLISGCKDNNPMLRNGITGDWIGTFIGHKGAVWQSRLSSNATYAVTGSADFTSKVWDTTSGECLFTMQHNHIVRGVAFEPVVRPFMVATGGFEKKLRLFDINDNASAGGDSVTSTADNIGNTQAPSIEIGAGIHHGNIKSIVWAEQNVIITASEDKVIRWWDIRAECGPLAKYALDGPLGTCELSYLPDSTDIASSILAVSAGKTAYFFAGGNPGQLIREVKTPHEIASLAVNYHDNKFVTGGSADTWIREYSFDEGQQLNVHKGHHGPVWSTSFSPDGKLCATGSEDGTIKLWKLGKEPYGLWR